MADHAALRAQNDAALERARPYLARQDGWEQIHQANGVTSWFNRAEHVIKIEGTVNKSPEFTLKFVVANLSNLRQKHLAHSVSTEVIQKYEEEKSQIVKLVNNNPQFGENTIYEYGSARFHANGTVDLIQNSPDAAQYPRGHSWTTFHLNRLEPTNEGSRLTVVFSMETTLAITEEQKTGFALLHSTLYENAAAELNAAA